MTACPQRITEYAGDRMTDEELERLLFHMPVVAECATDEWVKGFATDMAKRSRWRNWRPKPKQLAKMRELVADLFAKRGGDDAVIES